MIRSMLRRLGPVLAVVAGLSAQAREYVVPAGDVGAFFATLPEDATYLSFSAASDYASAGDIVLPATRMLVIDGKGCRLVLGPASHGFTSPVADQKEATRHLSCRYAIRDFGSIEGGTKAVDLQATLGSSITDCRFSGQTEVAIDLRFCLMARLQNVLVTNPKGKGIVLRQGDWPGATATNAQSNSSVLEQCRVYCSSTTTSAYTVLNSGGVRMMDCVSEGAEADHDLFLSAAADGDESRPAGNPVVKSFLLSNFHVEHRVRKASIYVNMPSKAVVDLQDVYWSGPQTAPVILYAMGQLDLSDIGWWTPEHRIRTRISAPRITITGCHSALNMGEKGQRTDKQAGVLELMDAFPGNEQLKLNYVVVRDRSM